MWISSEGLTQHLTMCCWKVDVLSLDHNCRVLPLVKPARAICLDSGGARATCLDSGGAREIYSLSKILGFGRKQNLTINTSIF